MRGQADASRARPDGQPRPEPIPLGFQGQSAENAEIMRSFGFSERFSTGWLRPTSVMLAMVAIAEFARAEPASPVAACSARQGRWFAEAPPATVDVVYGVGAGRSYEAAVTASRVAPAAALGVQVERTSADRQSVEQIAARAREGTSPEVGSQAGVERALEGCRVLEACHDGTTSAYHVMTRCYLRSQDERARESLATVAKLPACGAERPWVARAPAVSAEHVFGVGIGSNLEAAEASARVRTAEALGIEVRSRTSDRQVLWQKGGKAGDATEFEQLADTFVARRLEGCDVVDRCRDARTEAASVLLQCFRRSQFEREVERLGATMVVKFPKSARILVVPGTDKEGFITGLGELGSSALRAAVDKGLPPGASLVRVHQWEPELLHEVARKAGATHLLRFEYARKGTQAVHLEAWLQRAENDLDVAGTVAVAEVELDDSAASLLDARGPLLPQKDALSVAAELSPKRLRAKLPARMREGTEVRMEFQLPATGYFYVFAVGETGDVSMLRPMAGAPDALAARGTLRFPSAEFTRIAGAPLIACGVPGRKLARENVKAVLTSKPLDLPAFNETEPFLSFDRSGTARVATLLEALNKARREGTVLADETVPYLIEASARGRGDCP